VEVLASRLCDLLDESSIPFEIIFVDDSTDDTPARIVALNHTDGRIKLRRLTRRFGQNAAIFAGLELASGSATIVMDADLEDPPQTILRLIAEWQRGFDVVAVRRQRAGTALIYALGSKIYYKLINAISDVEIPPYVGEFRLIDQRVLKFLNSLPEHMKFFRGLSIWAGHKTKIIDIKRDERLAGTSNYNLYRSFAVAVDSILSFSFVPLRLISIAGLILSVFTALLGLAYLIRRFLTPEIFGIGWTSIFLAIMFFSSVNLLFLGVVAEYVGRIFRQSQGRPTHIVDYDLGFSLGKSETISSDIPKRRPA